MKLEVGKTYLTRVSEKVLIIYQKLTGDQPFIGVRICDSGEECLEAYSAEGYYTDSLSGRDIVSEYREPLVRWAVFDECGTSLGIYQDKEFAQVVASNLSGKGRVAKLIEVME